ncbi:MAG: hypothetical protein DRQ42_04170 [Gammaproteobacteria bacterium]|nr:MAG: hypothetical protein DRQ42_04170 [Gammaproteobacteria bacterium]
MLDFLTELRRLEWDPTQGLWAPAIVDHSNQRLDFAGANYAGFDELINGYTIQITGVATRVDLLGSNNNIVDVLIPTGVSVVPSNSAGLQIVSTGSGLDSEQDNKLTYINERLDGDITKPNTYADDGSQITNGDWSLDKTDNGNGTADVQRS